MNPSSLGTFANSNYVLYAAAIVLAAVLVAVIGQVMQRHRNRKIVRWDTTARERRSAGDRTGEDRLTFVVAGLATAVSAQGMWKFFGDVLHFNVYLRVTVFAFLELAMFTSALRARRNLSDPNVGTAGVDGVAVWVFTCLSAALSALDSSTIQEAVFRLSAPVVAAWLWERGMSIQRRRNGKSVIHWRITPERVLVRLGVAEASDRTATDVDAHRRLGRVARAAKQVRVLRAATEVDPRRLARAEQKLDKAMEAAVEHAGVATDPARQRAMIAQVGALFHAGTVAELDVAPPWTLQARAAHQSAEPRPALRREDGFETRSSRRSRKSSTVDRRALVEEVAEQILDAEAEGIRYRVDWEYLKQQSGNQKRWCENVVRDAKRLAVQRRTPALESGDGSAEVYDLPAANGGELS